MDVLLSERFVGFLQRFGGTPCRVRITGYPSCGKTYLSQALHKVLGRAIHVQSESWIFPLQYRKEQGLSGAHPEGYDIAAACKDLGALLDGQTVALREYSHRIGDHDAECSVSMSPGDHLILDGTPFALSEFKQFAGPCIFLVPADPEDWLSTAISRDVSTRFFSKSEATRHNMRKIRDIERMQKEFQNDVLTVCVNITDFSYGVPR